MFELPRLVRENRKTSIMLLFVTVLYSSLFFAGLFVPRESGPSTLKSESAFTASQLKEKEATARQNLMAQPKLVSSLSFILLAVLAAGLAMDAYLLTRGFRERPWARAISKAAMARWGVREVIQVFVFMYFIEGLVFIAQTFWVWATGMEKIQQDFFLLGNTLFRNLSMVAFIWIILRLRGQSWRDLGIRGESFFKNVKTGVLGYIAVIPPMFLIFFILAILMQIFSYEPLPQNVVQIYLKKNPGSFLFLFTLFVVILGPVLEEIFFRGFAYPALKKRLGTFKAMTVTATVFATFHMSLTAFVPVFLLGFFLTYLYESSGSLVPSITAHMLHNTLLVAVTLGFRSLAGSA